MKSVKMIASLSLLVLLVLAIVATAFAQDKDWVCHKPGTSAEMSKYVPDVAIRNGHLNHGDTLGKCASDLVEATPIPPALTPTPTPIPPTITSTPTTQVPTVTPTQEPPSQPTSQPVSQPASPTATATSEPASLPVSQPASCEPGLDCDPCAIVREALAQGKLILIADEDHVSIFPGTVQVNAGDELVIREPMKTGR